MLLLKRDWKASGPTRCCEHITNMETRSAKHLHDQTTERLDVTVTSFPLRLLQCHVHLKVSDFQMLLAELPSELPAGIPIIPAPVQLFCNICLRLEFGVFNVLITLRELALLEPLAATAASDRAPSSSPCPWQHLLRGRSVT